MITLNRELLERASRLPYVSYASWDSEFDGRDAEDQDGFIFLGAGCERTVWLGPDGMVYKCDGRYGGQQNYNEYVKYQKLSASVDLPCWVYIPETKFDEKTGINVAEYVGGETPSGVCYYDMCECRGPCIWEMCNDAFDYVGSLDGHPGNAKVIRGNGAQDIIVAVIDFTR
jgi:hypothetical protein